MCGSFGWGLQAELCSTCISHLIREPLRRRTCDLSGLSIFYNWKWSRTNDLILRQMIEMHKNGNWPTLSSKVAQIWAQHLLQSICDKDLNNWRIIFAPSQNINDHARTLALELSRHTGITTVDLLVKKKYESQKMKTREQRREVRFDRRENFTVTKLNFIFVDDVVTTGATARAAKQALSGGKSLIVYSLCWRERLRQEA